MTIYEANTVQWKIGDIVIHDCDAKNASMLMKVLRYNREGLAVCVYLHDQSRYIRPKQYPNDVKYLHAPKRFGIEVPR